MRKVLLALLICAALLMAAPYTATKNVTTAGTAEALVASSKKCFWVIITAKSANTGNIFVGDSTVSSTNATPLAADDSIMRPAVGRNYTYDLSQIYVDASVNGEGVLVDAECRP